MHHHPAQVSATQPCPCGAICPLCGSGAHDVLCVGITHDPFRGRVEQTYLLCTRCSLEFRDDAKLVRYADGDAPYRRVSELLTSIETVASLAGHNVAWRNRVAWCDQCGAIADANDGEAYLNGYLKTLPLARPCKHRRP